MTIEIDNLLIIVIRNKGEVSKRRIINVTCVYNYLVYMYMYIK